MIDFQSEHLRTFLAVLERGTFDAAAAALHVTASAVSQRIKAMENIAGQTLLIRSTPIAPTVAGASVHRLARQMRQLEADCQRELGIAGSGLSTIRIVANADSIATWFIGALASVPRETNLSFEVLREDEQHSVSLLRTGAAMAAVTATASPVQGCSSQPLGWMAYRALASREFMGRHFPSGFVLEKLHRAPVVQFDRTDTLQTNFCLNSSGRELEGPAHYIPDTLQFNAAVHAGLGWGLLPVLKNDAEPNFRGLVELDPGQLTRVPLFWQRWKLDSPALDAVTESVVASAGRELFS